MQTTKTKQAVLNLLQWNEEDLAMFQFNCGITYIRAYVRDENKAILRQLEQSKIFWQWWKDQWTKRDEVLVDSIVNILKVDIARQLYTYLHEPVSLAAEVYPAGVKLSDSYAKMIGDFNQKEQKVA